MANTAGITDKNIPSRIESGKRNFRHHGGLHQQQKDSGPTFRSKLKPAARPLDGRVHALQDQGGEGKFNDDDADEDPTRLPVEPPNGQQNKREGRWES